MKTIRQLLGVTLAGFVLGASLAIGSDFYTMLVAGGLAAIAIGLLYCVIFLLHWIYVSTAESIVLHVEYDIASDKTSMQGPGQRGTLKIRRVFLQK